MTGKNHIERELLLRYAMSEAPILDVREETKLALEDVRYVERHLQECTACQRQLELLKEAVEAGDHLLSKIVESHLHVAAVETVRPKKYPLLKWGLVLGPAVGVGVAFFFLSPTGRAFINPSIRVHASVESEVPASIQEVTKGVSPMADGAFRFSEGDYAGAVESFKRAASASPEDGDRGLARLNIGLTFLSMAEHRELGLFYKFDAELVDSALAHLNASLSMTTIHPRMQETALYFSAKAHLMRNDPAAALVPLEACVAIRGMKFREAEKLLKEIQNYL